MTIGRPDLKHGFFDGLERRFLEEMDDATVAALRTKFEICPASPSLPPIWSRSNLDRNGNATMPSAGVVLENDDLAET